MLKNAYTKQRHGVWQKTLVRVLLPIFVLGASLSVVLSFTTANHVEAATANTLNFQGRLLTNTGAVVPDGSYNIEFKIYDSASSGASAPGACSLNSSSDDCWWIESRTVTVQDGYYSVYLADVASGGTAFTSGLPWDQDLWLTMNVNSDGEMSPRFKLTAVPYAFRAGALVDASGNAKTADQFAQLAPTSVQSVNSAVAALRLSQAGAGALIQMQNGSTDVFTVSNTGGATLGSSSNQGQLTLHDGNGGQTTTFRAGNSASDLTFIMPDSLGSALQCLRNSSTPGTLEFGDCGSSVMPFVSKTKTANETQNNVNNPTATLQADDELFFNIGANETWNFRFQLQATVNATPDIKFSVSGPSGATCTTGFADIENAVSLANVVGCGTSSGNMPVITGVDVFEISGSITNGATAGTVTLNWAQNTANAANTIIHAGSFVEASRSVGGSSADVAFIQNGNSFGGLATLGTNDANGLAFETNGVERMQLLSTGEIRASDDVIANRTATGTTGTTSGTGTNTTTLTLTADAFAVNDVIFIDNVGQDYYTRVTVDPGTGSYTVSPAVTFGNARTVTKYTIQNIGATESDYSSQANRFFQGYFLGGVVVGAGSTTISDGNIESTTDLNLQAGGGNVVVGGGLSVTGTITGDGAGLTNINGASISGSTITGLDATNVASGTLSDSRLSANVALLTGAQTFSGAKDFSAGLTVSAGNIGVTGNVNASGSITGATIVGDGSGLSNLEAGDIATGTLSDARLSANVALLAGTQTFSGAKDFSAGLTVSSGGVSATGNISATAQISGATILGDGSGLSNLEAGDIASGTLNDARLSANVVLLSGSQTFTGSKTFTSGGLVLGQSTLSSSATVARAVSFPDEAGTVCLSNKDTCGYLRLASGAAQTDASNNDVMAVNKTSATGNLINLQRSATPVFTVANSGALQIQSTSSTAMDIRNAAGTSYFTVNTNTGSVEVGAGTAAANGVLFVLDTRTADPTGVNGGSYYNLTRGKLRCFENSTWRDCVEQSSIVKPIDQFVANNAVFQNDTSLVFNMAANSTYQIEATIAYVTSSAAADYKYTFTAPVGATITLYADATTSVNTSTICSITASGQTCALANTANLRGTITVRGVVTTGATAGNLQLQYAQNTAVGGQLVTVFAGSSLSYRQL